MSTQFHAKLSSRLKYQKKMNKYFKKYLDISIKKYIKITLCVEA